MGGPIDEQRLMDAAKATARHAYCPYSFYPVGAAIVDEVGTIHTGCNVESVAFTPGVCAERVALGKLVSAGARRVEALAVYTKDGGWPCGACRQLLSEFVAGDDVPVLAIDERGNVARLPWRELFPHGFRSTLVSHED